MGERYEGWANYETWAMALWMINERRTYEQWIERAEEVEENYELAEEMKQEIAAEAPALGEPWGSMMEAGLAEVDWLEIAEEFRTKAREQA